MNYSNIPPYEEEDEDVLSDGLPYSDEELADDSQEAMLDDLGDYDEDDEAEEVLSDGLPHLNENFASDSQEDQLDELGEYSDDEELDPEEVLYGEDNTDFDYAYYDNADEWEGIENQDEV